jgi:hypothetical protein
MDPAVEFHRERRFDTEEVDDEGPHRDLPSPLPALQATPSQRPPKAALRVRLIASKLARAIPAEL